MELKRMKSQNLLVVVLSMFLGTGCALKKNADPGSDNNKSPESVADRFKRLCTTPDAQAGYVQILIDANSVSANGSLTLQPNDRAQIVFTHKNPFKYRYRFVLSSEPLDTTRISEYLDERLFKKAETPGTKAGAEGGVRAEATDTCKGGTEDAQKAVSILENDSVALDRLVSSLSGAYTHFLEETAGDSLGEDEQCQKVLTDASSTVTTLAGGVDAQKNLTNLATELQKAVAAVAVVKDTACQASLEKSLTPIAEKWSSEKQAALKTQLDELSKAATFIGNTLAEDNLIHETRYVYVPQEPTLVQAQVFRTNLRQKDAVEQAAGKIEFRAGEGRVTISAGAMYSRLASHSVIRQPTLITHDDGTSRLGAKFDYSEDSSFTVAPVVLLNVRVLDPGWFLDQAWMPPLHITGGVLAAEENGHPRPDFIAGLSLSFADTVFLTAGAHFGERDELVGFQVGDPVPEDLQDPLPTKRRWQKAATFALTFKLR